MPKLKKEPVKKTAVKKPRVKKADKAEKIEKKNKPWPKARPITVDVIADDEEVLFQNPTAGGLPEDNAEERASLDVRQKFYSDLVAEMKDKKADFSLTGKLPTVPEDKTVKSHKSLNLYRRIAFQFVGLTILLFLVVAYFFLPSLKITLHPSAEAIADSLTINIAPTDNGQSAVSTTSGRFLAGDIQTVPVSAEKVYEASGEEILGEEVAGEVTLHNEYIKDQPLVAKTRLLSQDNKLFRLKEAVNVPAGGTVKAEVYADQPTEAMAIAPTRFTIPGLWLGLQNQIYATSEDAFEYRHQVKHYVKQSDLDQATSDIKQTLAVKADNLLAERKNDDSKAFAYSLDDDAATVKLGAKVGEEKAEFTVSAENNITIASFSKKQAEALVKAKLAFLLPDDKELSAFDSQAVNYRLETFDVSAKTATVIADFKSSMSLRTDADIVDRRKLVNLKQAQISEYLHTFPEIETYELKFSPSFINRAPSLADRIKVEVVQ